MNTSILFIDSILKQENIVAIGSLSTALGLGIGYLISTISKQWLAYVRERNQINAITDKAKLDDCEQVKARQQDVIESFRSALIDFSNVVDVLNKSVEAMRKDNEVLRKDLMQSRRDYDDAKGELTVAKALQFENLKTLHAETKAQLENLVSILSKFIELSVSNNNQVNATQTKTTIEVHKVVEPVNGQSSSTQAQSPQGS